MKRTIYLSLIAIVAILFSSCGSLTISQKRYSRGLHIDWFVAKGKTEDAPVKVRTKEKKLTNQGDSKLAAEQQYSELEMAAIEEQMPEAAASFVNDGAETVISAPEIIKEKGSVKRSGLRKKVKAIREMKSVLKENKKASINSANNFSEINKTNESDVALILLVLIALILPPLAVYLYFGEIETHFWINIILCLLFGVSFGIFGFGGFGLAVIHALLVVFGVFD